jgi:PAS domain S-box
MKILVIDDDHELNLLTTMALRGAGYEVLEARTGTEGIEKAHIHRPDVILLNIILPDISGVEACRQIKKDHDLKDIFVILTSGTQTSSEYQAKESNTGADSFIVKPISNEQLLARIQSGLRIKRIEEALQASETRYRRLFETAQDGILILNEETGQIDDVNPFLKDMLGYTHEEFMGKKLWEIGAFKNTEATKAALAELQHKGYVRYEDLPLTTKDGREIDVEFVSNVYLVNRHKVIQCNIRDITKRKLVEEERERLILELREALSQVKLLSGLLPICTRCKKIRNDKGYWEQIETYIRDHSEADFSHSFCPECAEKLYPEHYKKK